jgi:hypothetical protein
MISNREDVRASSEDMLTHVESPFLRLNLAIQYLGGWMSSSEARHLLKGRERNGDYPKGLNLHHLLYENAPPK